MKTKITSIQYKKDYIFHIKYNDNNEGDINFKPFIWGEAFIDLKNLDYFKKAYIDKTTGTVSWPEGPDIAPETLYEKIIDQSNSRISFIHKPNATT